MGRRGLNPRGGVFSLHFVHVLSAPPLAAFPYPYPIPQAPQDPMKTLEVPVSPLPHPQAHLQLLLTILSPCPLERAVAPPTASSVNIPCAFTHWRDFQVTLGLCVSIQGDDEQCKQHLFPSTFCFAPGEPALTTLKSSVLTLVLKSAQLE